jgi:hypothetical protein
LDQYAAAAATAALPAKQNDDAAGSDAKMQAAVCVWIIYGCSSIIPRVGFWAQKTTDPAMDLWRVKLIFLCLDRWKKFQYC